MAELTEPWGLQSGGVAGHGHDWWDNAESWSDNERRSWVPSDDPRCQQFRPAPDSSWLLGNCFKIIMMQAGFAVVESSFVRKKNSANIMMKNVVDICAGALGFWAFGWAIAYGVDPKDPTNVNGFAGTGEWLMIQGYDYAMWMFQFSFAATAATIDSGAVAERMNFKPYVIYSVMMTSFFQPVVCHWCWDVNGWLTKMGFHDFAGSGPVHLVGGASALVAAWLIGPRTGRFTSKDTVGKLEVTVVQGESLPTNGRTTHPYVVVQQENHGDKEARTRVAENSNHPRWGTKLNFDVKREQAEEEQNKKELELDGDLYVRWQMQTEEDEQEYHGTYSHKQHTDTSKQRGSTSKFFSSTFASFKRRSQDRDSNGDSSTHDMQSSSKEGRSADTSGKAISHGEPYSPDTSRREENGQVTSDDSGSSITGSRLSRGLSLAKLQTAASRMSRMSQASSSFHQKSQSGKSKRQHTIGFVEKHLHLDPDGLVTVKRVVAGDRSKRSDTTTFKIKHIEKIDRWVTGKCGFTIQLDDMRQLDVECESEEVRQQWMSRILKIWRPTISTQKLHLLLIDDELDEKLGEADFTISAASMRDPEKFKLEMMVPLDQGGRIELRVHYTSATRMTREIFQACDPVKLLFGTFVLWVNWYSFNVGSTTKITGGGVETASRAALTTTLAAAAGAILSMIISDLAHGYVLPETLTTGLLGSLVAITAPCAVVTEGESVVIGMIGALLAIYGNLWETWMQIDDPCSAFPIHGAAGIWGVLAVGLFAQPEPCMDSALRMEDGTQLKGIFRGGDGKLLGVQLLACVAITAWSVTVCFVSLGTMHWLSKFEYFRWLALRPTKHEEEQGFDQTEHNVRRVEDEGRVEMAELPRLKANSLWRKIDLKSLADHSKAQTNQEGVNVDDGAGVGKGGGGGVRARGGIAAAILAAAKKQKLEEEAANQCGGTTADAEEIKPEVEVRTPLGVNPLATAQTSFTVSSSLGFTSQQAITATAGKATVKVADSHRQVRPPRLSEMRQQAAVIHDVSDGSSLNFAEMVDFTTEKGGYIGELDHVESETDGCAQSTAYAQHEGRAKAQPETYSGLFV